MSRLPKEVSKSDDTLDLHENDDRSINTAQKLAAHEKKGKVQLSKESVGGVRFLEQSKVKASSYISTQLALLMW